MTDQSKYLITGYVNPDATEKGYDADREADTLKDAKREAKYMLSERYMLDCESTQMIKRVQILKRGRRDERDECVDDIFAKVQA
jgi:hypothetical protein